MFVVITFSEVHLEQVHFVLCFLLYGFSHACPTIFCSFFIPSCFFNRMWAEHEERFGLAEEGREEGSKEERVDIGEGINEIRAHSRNVEGVRDRARNSIIEMSN